MLYKKQQQMLELSYENIVKSFRNPQGHRTFYDVHFDDSKSPW